MIDTILAKTTNNAVRVLVHAYKGGGLEAARAIDDGSEEFKVVFHALSTGDFSHVGTLYVDAVREYTTLGGQARLIDLVLNHSTSTRARLLAYAYMRFENSDTLDAISAGDDQFAVALKGALYKYDEGTGLVQSERAQLMGMFQ